MGRLICLVFTGTPSWETFLKILEKNDQPEWKELKEQLVTRITNLTVVGALVASVAVTFVASDAPSPIANWDEMLPYISFLACGLFSAMCVVSGLGLMVFLDAVQPQTASEMRTSQLRCAAVATLLAMPFLWFFAGLIAPLIGMTGAIWLGDSTFAKAGVVAAIAGLLATFLVVFASLF